MQPYLKHVFGISIGIISSVANSATLEVEITSSQGVPVKDTVVTLTSTSGQHKLKTRTEIIDQVDKTYVPHVKVITRGSKISFPNKDDIRHHVYSFSEARKFELPLYEGTPTNPVKFDRAGIVTLGCNIHDWMRAYIYIADTPYYSITDESGKTNLESIPGGEYTLKIWHPRLKSKEALSKRIALKKNESATISETISLKPAFKIRRAPTIKRRKY